MKKLMSRLARRAEEVEELRAVAGVARIVIREVVHVEAEGAVGGHLDQLPDLVHVAGLAVGGHAHHLVFPFIHLEAEERSENAVQ